MVQIRRRPALFRALGASEPPPSVTVGGRRYHRSEILKHDSWASTALYEGDSGSRIICKFNRQQPILIIPMKWLGRWLARREAWFLRELADVEAVPAGLGAVSVDARDLANAVAHEYIAGAPLMKFQHVDDDFFDRLSHAIATLHRRGLAYVDLHKKENIIVGADGRPYLIDFQISFRPPRGWLGRTAIIRKLHRQLVAIDLRCLAKHVQDCRPDLVTAEHLQRLAARPALLRWHRALVRPLRLGRRRLLVLLSIRSGRGLVESEAEPEDAVRRRMASDGRPVGEER